MKQKLLTILLTAVLAGTVLSGCAGSKPEPSGESTDVSAAVQAEESTDVSADGDTGSEAPVLEDGTYLVDFDTDSGMFHVNEAMEGKGRLTVADGNMTVHISLVSKKILNLYPGLAEDAQKEGALLLEPTLDTVTYSDGYSEEVFGFDVPVPYLDEEFDLALIGEKGTWYDHKVKVSDPEPTEETGENVSETVSDSDDGTTFSVDKPTKPEEAGLTEEEYTISVDLNGGSGKARVESPCTLKVEDGKCVAVITWSSPNYDYMVVDGVQYDPVNEDGNSVFEIPVEIFGQEIPVQADTVAMSKPHLIDYTLTFGAK